MASVVGFVGIGIMGGRMAKNVLKAGHGVRAYNRTREKAEALQPAGAAVVGSPREAAQGAVAVITMVADPLALRAVLEGPEGVFAGCPPGALVIDMSTVDPETSRTMGKQATARGLRYLEAPVTGGVGAAEQGTLTIMAGGSAEDFAAATPLLNSMGKKILHVGSLGQGAVMKLAVNLVAASIITSMVEALGLATKAGLDPQLVVEVLSERSPLIGRSAPRILAGDYAARFPLKLSHKDVQLALAAARDLGIPMFALASVAQLQAAALAKGYGELDQTATMQVLEELGGFRVRSGAV
ncbi:MAG TPA: NAD(P)-dependent oxidoreductase [Candidatus Acidoferrum sp.]|nr:NAD(P)-dependent oxidoreductase [Candidatus Acidoferrum sp.]